MEKDDHKARTKHCPDDTPVIGGDLPLLDLGMDDDLLSNSVAHFGKSNVEPSLQSCTVGSSAISIARSFCTQTNSSQSIFRTGITSGASLFSVSSGIRPWELPDPRRSVLLTVGHSTSQSAPPTLRVGISLTHQLSVPGYGIPW